MTDHEFSDELVSRMNRLLDSTAYREDHAFQGLRGGLTYPRAWALTQAINAVVRGGQDYCGGIEARFDEDGLLRLGRSKPANGKVVRRR